MTHKLVKGSNVHSVDYNRLTGKAEVIFENGQRGTYFGVSPEDATLLETAESPGSVIHSTFKPKYKYERGEKK